MKKFPKNLFNLFFGSSNIQTVVSVDYEEELYKDFWNRVNREYYRDSDEWFSAIWNYLYVYYDPEMEKPLEPTND
jgi:hypothetical protein